MAINNYFKIYLEQCFALAETLVIKSLASANGINRRLVEVYGKHAVDYSRPETWKYYLNISGQYHPTDTKMKIISLDTLEEIDFTRENLKIHRATHRAYTYGSRYYLELVNRHQNQEMLILGILYPVDIDTAIKAKDFTILGYPSDLVEFNEYDFIKNLQEWLFKYIKQWRNPQYSVSDELFEAACLAQMYMNILPAILNLRLRACRTNQAHSYHVRRYLASHGFLDEYLDHLLPSQALWCYRNINYIERYAGHTDTFEWMIENLLTVRQIPIGGYDMRHDIEKQPNGVEVFNKELYENGEAIYPTVMFRKENLNPISPAHRRNYKSLPELFENEDKLAVDNPRYRDDDTLSAKTKMENSLSNRLNTKVLESSMLDYTDSQAFTLADTLVNHWINRAFNGTYRAAVVVTNPATGERLPLTAKESVYLAYYCWRKSAGQNPTHLPVITASRVPRFPRPSVNDIRKHVPHKRISKEAAQFALDLMPITGSVYSIDAFYNESVEYWRAANLQNNLISTYEHLDDRAYAENMVSRIYQVMRWTPGGAVTFEDWFAERSINVKDFTEEQYQLLFDDIIDIATGRTLFNTISTRSLQKALISLLGQLSSYSIHFITDINNSNIRQVEGSRVRVGDRKGTTVSRIDITELEVEVLEVKTSPVQRVEFDANKIDNTDTWEAKTNTKFDYELVDFFTRQEDVHHRYGIVVNLNRITINHDYGTYPNSIGIPPMWSTDRILGLDKLDSFDLVDIYQRDLGCSVRAFRNDVNLSENFVKKESTGFADFKKPFRLLFANQFLPGFDKLQVSLGDYLDHEMDGFKDYKVKLRAIFTKDKLPGFSEEIRPISHALKTSWLPGFEKFTEEIDITKRISQLNHLGLRLASDVGNVQVAGVDRLFTWRLTAGHYVSGTGVVIETWADLFKYDTIHLKEDNSVVIRKDELNYSMILDNQDGGYVLLTEYLRKYDLGSILNRSLDGLIIERN